MFEIGNSLREARLRQGLELADLEEQTKVRGRYLRALEEEQFALLPGESYVRGFLRLYAERLGLDGQLYVDEYNSRFSNVEEPVPTSHTRRRAQTNKAESRAVIVALAGILFVTVLVIAAWRFGTGATEEDGGLLPTIPATLETDPGTAPAATDSETEPPITAVALVATAVRGPTHLVVRDGTASGVVVWEGDLAQGASSDAFEGERLWLEVSKPANVEFALDGFPVRRPDGKGPLALVASSAGLERAPSP